MIEDISPFIERLIKFVLRDKKFLTWMALGFAILGILGMLSDSLSFYLYNNYSMDVQATALLFIALAFIIFGFIYLQSGSATSGDELVSLSANDAVSLRNAILNIEKKIAEANHRDSNNILSANERKKLIQDIGTQIGNNQVTSIFETKTAELKSEIAKSLSFDRLKVSSDRIINRLRREIDDLRRRSNINLMIGMAITAGGLYLLWDTIQIINASDQLKTFAQEGEESNAKFAKAMILPIVPRFLLVVFIEIFAYFFLSLYRNGLNEIKYFQNELTNIESKLAAVEFAYITQNDSLSQSIEALCKTERNFILEKGQTTVELEKARADSEFARGLMKSLPSILKKEK